jgi:hypothetical protein
VTTPNLLKTFLLVFALTSIVQLFLRLESRQQYNSQIFESNKAPGYVPGIDKDWAAASDNTKATKNFFTRA